MNIVLAGAATVVYVSFIAGVWLVFRKIQPDPTRLKILKVAALLAAVTYVVLIARTAPTVFQFVAGGALYSLSLLLFLWASHYTRRHKLSLAFSEDTPNHLLSDGPWGYVRHPFYAAYLLSYVAGTVASGTGWTIAVFVVMATIYCLAAQHEERKFAGSDVHEEWLEWKRRTGMFWPRFGQRQQA